MASFYPPPMNAPRPVYPDSLIDPSKVNVATGVRYVTRTPSPTPSEAEILQHKGLNGKLNLKKYMHKKYIPHIIIACVLLAVTILSLAFHKQIVDWLEPIGNKLRHLPAGWLIPVAIFVVLSFPPLFGHEIVAIVVGLVWGIGEGFGIVALGTLLGELANFYVFRYFLRNRAERYEQKNLKYALLAHVAREGGFMVILMLRLSAIPPHFTTLVFSLSGTPSLIFILAAVLSLPKQLSEVVLGSMTSDNNSSKENHSKLISGITIAVTVVVTIVSMRYINRKVDEVKPLFVRLRQKARQAQMQAQARAIDSEHGIYPPNSRDGLMAISLARLENSPPSSSVIPHQKYAPLY